MKAKLRAAIESVEDGSTLADALVIDSTFFPDRLIILIRLGEASNNLGPVVARAAEMLRAEAQLRREAQQALIYPTILLFMSLLVLAVLVFYLAPTLAPVFASADTPAPGVIRSMVWLEQVLTDFWPIVVGAALILTLVLYLGRAAITRGFQRVLQWIPMTRRYLAKRETLQLCQTLYLTLSSGGGVSAGIKAAASTTRLATWQDMLTKAHQKIEAGQSVTQALLSNPRIDPMASNILKTGEESDQLIAVLPPAIASLQSQTSQTLSQAVKLMTPLITIGIGLAIGAIILSTISAIMDLNDAVF
jgi:general secretion pathway protein F